MEPLARFVDADYRTSLLADADLVLAFFANRFPYTKNAVRLFEIVSGWEIPLYVTESCRERVRCSIGRSDAEAIAVFDGFFGQRIVAVDRNILAQARISQLKSFDAAVEVAVAIQLKLGAIVTDDPEKYSKSNISVLTVDDLLHRQNLETLLNQNLSESLSSDTMIFSINRLEENLYFDTGFPHPNEEIFDQELDDTVNVALWLQEDLDAFAQKEGWEMPLSLTTIENSSFRLSSQQKRILGEFKRREEIPTEAYVSKLNVPFNQINFELLAVTWKLPKSSNDLNSIHASQEWVLMLILGRGGGFLPDNVGLNITKTREKIPVNTAFDDYLETDACYFRARANATIDEQLVATIMLGDEELELPPFCFQVD